MPRTRTRIVLFDFDGTLVDSRAVIVAALRTALDHAGIAHDHHPDEALAGHIGAPLPRLLPLLGVDPAQTASAIAEFQAHFHAHGPAATVVFPGVDALLDDLDRAGLTIGLATAKPARVARRVLRHLGWEQRFSVLAGAGDDETGGDKDVVIGHALQLLAPAVGSAVEPASVVMVGDRAVDIEGARHHGIDAIGVTWGFGRRSELADARPAAIVDSPAELARLLAARGGLVDR